MGIAELNARYSLLCDQKSNNNPPKAGLLIIKPGLLFWNVSAFPLRATHLKR